MDILVSEYTSPVGELVLGSYGDRLCLCDWKYRKMRDSINKRVSNQLQTSFVPGDSEVMRRARAELEAYFSGKKERFETPLLPAGSDFQQKIWKLLMQIPFGETCSYLELSRRFGDEKAIRAVAAANGANALSVFIPCHRVVGSSGELTGYAGGVRAKKALLEIEGGVAQLALF